MGAILKSDSMPSESYVCTDGCCDLLGAWPSARHFGDISLSPSTSAAQTPSEPRRSDTITYCIVLML